MNNTTKTTVINNIKDFALNAALYAIALIVVVTGIAVMMKLGFGAFAAYAGLVIVGFALLTGLTSLFVWVANKRMTATTANA